MLKHIESERFDENKIEVLVQAEQRKEIKFIGSLRKIPGHVMWEYNYVTGLLILATYKKEEVLELKTLSLKDKSLLTEKKTIVIKDDCFYFQSLNRKNAIKQMRIRGFVNFQ